MSSTTATVVLRADVVILVVLSLPVRGRTPRTPDLGLSPEIPRVHTTHARERMVQRRVSKEQVESVLTSPDRQRPGPEEGSIRFENYLELGTLKVWVVA